MRKTFHRAMKTAAMLAGVGIFSLSAHAQEKPKAYLVSDAHLDTQWNWDVQTTISEYVKNTLFQNLMYLRQNPDYIFNFEGAVKYKWMKEYYPYQYDELKKYIKEGRWHLTGSGWDATEAVVSSTESAIRNILYGQTWYRQEFGTESTDIFLPDCFGFPYTLPTVAAHCGLIGFSSQKLGWRYNAFYDGGRRYPFPVGLWQGVDGSRIMMAHGYDYGKRFDGSDLSRDEKLQKLAESSPTKNIYHYYGTGDVGGSPTTLSIQSVLKGAQGDGPLQIVSATSDQLYKDYLPFDQHPELPLFDGELLMDVHGNACYTSQAALKLYNRQNELLGDVAERAASMADVLGGLTYPHAQITENWQRIIWHQFHDDLTGTSIPKAYEWSWNDELLGLGIFRDVITSSIARLSASLDTKTSGTPVVVFNPLAYEVSDFVTLCIGDKALGATVYDQNGKKVRTQAVLGIDGKYRLLAEAKMPAMGVAVYDVRYGKAASIAQRKGNTIENSAYRLTVDANGDITSLFDKRVCKELVESGKAIRLAYFDKNESFAWPAWEVLKKTIDQTPHSITGDVNVSLETVGQLVKTLRIEKTQGDSRFVQLIHLYEGPRAERIDIDNIVDWASTDALLKAEFPLTVANPFATYDLGIGSVRRDNNTDNKFEVPSHDWTDLTATDGSYGVTFMSDYKYGWDKPSDNTLRLTLLHTPKTDRGYAYQDHQDWGHHQFRYSIVGHFDQLDKPATVRRAEQYNSPLLAFTTSRHAGNGRERSFLSIDNPCVTVKAVKRAETSNEWVIRVYETEGKSEQTATITLAADIAQAVEADGTEKPLAPIASKPRSFTFSIKPYSVKTFKLTLAETPAAALAAQPVALPYNIRTATYNEKPGEFEFADGYSYAAELLPAEITNGGVTFQLGQPTVENAVECKGQTLALPVGYNRLYLLAAARKSDVKAQFTLGASSQEVLVPHYNEHIGQWGHTDHTMGYLKDATVAYVGSHRHDGSGDQPYEYTYMFRIGLDVPNGATELRLPDNSEVAIFAATAVREDNTVLPAVPLFFTSNVCDAKDAASQQSLGENLALNAKVTADGFMNNRERPEFAVDGNEETKWCHVGKNPLHIALDLGQTKTFSAWRVLSAGIEQKGYITADCFLQGRNSEGEEWTDIDSFTDNRTNDLLRKLPQPVSFRHLRLVITRGTDKGEPTARIYEIGLYQ